MFFRSKRRNPRSSSLAKDSFIRDVEAYIKNHPEIIYNDLIKEKLVDYYEQHNDVAIKKYLGW